MGFFKKVFSGREEYPELDAASPAAQRLEPLRPVLEDLARQFDDHLEVVPCPRGAFVFIGKPPKRFGAAWIHEGQVTNLKDLAAAKNLSAAKMGSLVEKLRDAYEHGANTPRFTAQVAGKKVVVAPSEHMGKEVEEILEKYAG